MAQIIKDTQDPFHDDYLMLTRKKVMDSTYSKQFDI